MWLICSHLALISYLLTLLAQLERRKTAGGKDLPSWGRMNELE